MNAPTFVEPEKLAYWYFRLNGFLTTVNFIIHPEIRGPQETDADILGVRFPYRTELVHNPMKDDNIFNFPPNKPYVVIAEVKTNECALNGPWKNKEKQNMPKVLKAIGVFPEDMIDDVEDRIYDNGYFENDLAYLTLCCVGSKINKQLKKDYPNLLQITWDSILRFIYKRFTEYSNQKADHPQWDDTPHKLWTCSKNSKDIEHFVKKIKLKQPKKLFTIRKQFNKKHKNGSNPDKRLGGSFE